MSRSENALIRRDVLDLRSETWLFNGIFGKNAVWLCKLTTVQAKIREYIEQRERDFTFPNSGLNVNEEVEKIRQMYEDLRLDIENNRPDRFVSSGNLARAPPQNISLARPQPSWSRNWNEKEISDPIERARGAASGFFTNARGMKDVLEDKLKELKELEQQMTEKGKQMEEEGKRDVVEKADATVREIGNVGEKLEHDARAALEKRIESRREWLDDAVTETQDSAHDAISRQGERAREIIGAQARNSEVVLPK